MAGESSPGIQVRCPQCQTAFPLQGNVVNRGARSALRCPECSEISFGASLQDHGRLSAYHAINLLRLARDKDHDGQSPTGTVGGGEKDSSKAAE
jgi:hypothetical protein